MDLSIIWQHVSDFADPQLRATQQIKVHSPTSTLLKLILWPRNTSLQIRSKSFLPHSLLQPYQRHLRAISSDWYAPTRHWAIKFGPKLHLAIRNTAWKVGLQQGTSEKIKGSPVKKCSAIVSERQQMRSREQGMSRKWKKPLGPEPLWRMKTTWLRPY